MPVKPRIWQTWCSYLWPVHIETVISEYSGQLEMLLDRGEWRLETARSIYSLGRYYPPFLSGIGHAGYPKEHGEILLLGLGSGSALDILRAAGRSYHITAVDIDPVIIALAQKYLDIPPGWEMAYACSDARLWLERNIATFDLVFADLFIHDQTPAALMQADFLEKLKCLLHPGGQLLFSTLYDTKTARECVQVFEQLFASIFPGYATIDTIGNRVFYWQKNH